MTEQELHEFLTAYTERERFYLKYPGAPSPRYQNMERKRIDGLEVLYFQLPTLRENEILIRKDSRFTQVPYYVHSNVNLNYIYSGTCSYVIDQKSITLHEGDVCIFDKDVVRHKLKTGENDIVMNISMSDEFFTGSLLHHMKEQSILASFLLNAISSSQSHDQYLIFRTNRSEVISSLFQKLFMEYFDVRLYRREVLQSYLMLILIELLRLYSSNDGQYLIQLSTNSADNLVDILHDIETNYIDGSLEALAEKFGYHPKYMSSLIKKRTGKTFKQIQLAQRLKIAGYRLKNTDDSIQRIAAEVGIHNLTFFYKCFQEQYHMSPAKYRNLDL